MFLGGRGKRQGEQSGFQKTKVGEPICVPWQPGRLTGSGPAGDAPPPPGFPGAEGVNVLKLRVGSE